MGTEERKDLEAAQVSLATDVEATTSPAPAHPPSPVILGWSARAVGRIAAAVVICGLALRTLATASGSLYWDDFLLQARASKLPLDYDFLFWDHDGHIMPGGMAVAWVTERISPLGFGLPIIEMIAFQALAMWLVWKLLKVIFGPRPLALALLTLYCISPLTLPGNVWWAASLNAIPLQLAMIAVVWGTWLLTRTDRRVKGQLLIVGGIIFGVLFFEKTLLLIPLTAGLVWMFGDGGVKATIAAQWRTAKWMWLMLVLLICGGFVAYTQVSARGLEMPADWSPVADSFRVAFDSSTITAVLGGPLNWTDTPYPFADPPGWWVAVSLEALAVLVIGGILMYRRASRAWLVALAYTLATVALYAFSRVARDHGTSIAIGAMRYTADALLPMLLAIGMSVMPLRGERESRRAVAVRTWLAQRKRGTIGWSIILANLVIIASVVSTLHFMAGWMKNPAGPYLANARKTMSEASKDQPIFNQDVPPDVLWGLAHPYNQIEWFFGPLTDKPPIGRSTTDPRFLNTAGELVPGVVNGVEAVPGTAPGGCGNKLKPGRNVLTLTGSPFKWDYVVGLNYLVGQDVDVMVSLGDGPPVPMKLAEGLGQSAAVVTGGGDQLVIDNVPDNVGICIGRAAVGTFVEKR